jgi:hypothetical protein
MYELILVLYTLSISRPSAPVLGNVTTIQYYDKYSDANACKTAAAKLHSDSTISQVGGAETKINNLEVAALCIPAPGH